MQGRPGAGQLRETIAAEMRARNLDPGGIRTEGLTLSAPSDDALLATMRDAAMATVEPGSPSDFSVDLSDGIMQLALIEARLARAAATAADSSLEVIRHGVDQIGVSEPVISRVGEDRILVQMPGVETPAQLRKLLASTAKMSFQMVAPRPGVSMLKMRDGCPAGRHADAAGDRGHHPVPRHRGGQQHPDLQPHPRGDGKRGNRDQDADAGICAGLGHDLGCQHHHASGDGPPVPVQRGSGPRLCCDHEPWHAGGGRGEGRISALLES